MPLQCHLPRRQRCGLIVRVAAAGKNSNPLFYTLVMHTAEMSDYRVRLHFGPGDDGSPVFTFMRPDEN